MWAREILPIFFLDITYRHCYNVLRRGRFLMDILIGIVSLPAILLIVSLVSVEREQRAVKINERMHCESCFYWNFTKQCCDLSADNTPSSCNSYEDYQDDFLYKDDD